MKKIIIVFAAVLVLATGIYLVISSLRGVKKGPPSSGGTLENFTVGVSGERTLKLSDFIGRYDIVLVFLDNGRSSAKYEALYKAGYEKVFSGARGYIWFEVKKDGRHAIIEEKTGSPGTRYRTLYSDIPSAYSFPAMPSALVADKSGTIRLVYNGYSPTMLRDIRAGLPSQAK